MEFWGVEVKSGEPLKVVPGDGMVLHLSQACLGELKKEKGNESVNLFVNVDGKKLVLGTLFTDKLPQQQFDLVFDGDFELSHNWKGGSVYFYGYKASNPVDDEMPGDEFDDSESDEDIPLTLPNNGGSGPVAKQDKPAEAERAVAAKEKKSAAGKHKVKIVEPNKAAKPQEDDESSDDSESDEDIPLTLPNNGGSGSVAKQDKPAEAERAVAAKEKKSAAGKRKVKIVEPNKAAKPQEDDESSDDALMSEEDDDSEDEDDSDESDNESDESDDETPKKVERTKKRPVESAAKTPVSDKKAKVTPEKTDGKKGGGGHVATPYPSKLAGKASASQQSKQAPKSGGSICKSCNRSFGSEKALESHNKAKHSVSK